MYKRPKRTDSESDLMEMQNEFYSNQTKNQDFQPAAKVFRKEVQNDNAPKVSKFAKQRGLTKKSDEVTVQQSDSMVLFGDIIERTASELNRPCSSKDTSQMFITTDKGFPKTEIASENIQFTEGRSIFAQNMAIKHNLNVSTSTEENAETEMEAIGPDNENQVPNDVHQENLQKLAQMTQQEILEEQEKLISSMDPKLIEFLKSRTVRTPQNNEKLKTETIKAPEINTQQKNLPEIEELEILQNNASKNWLNFDVVESEKLEWMKDIPVNNTPIKPGEMFEARFDWNGILLPYTNENSTVDQRELYLHGDDVHRAGYTLQELFRLARSNILQQRLSALGSISGILNLYNQGFYDNVLDLPITKIFFLLRFALDDNIPAILEVTSKALAYLFYNECDEKLLDILFDHEVGLKQPLMEDSLGPIKIELEDEMLQLNMNETTTKAKFGTNVDDQELSNKETLNDFHLAETDLIACFLRTNILERIRYILRVVKPDNSTVISCLKILIRLARSSKGITYKMIITDNLISTIFQYFLPKFQHQTNKDNLCYNRPQFLALKLFRLIAYQDTDNLIKLAEFGLFDLITGYIQCREEISETLILLQTEAFRFLRVFVKMTSNDDLLSGLLPAFRYLLEWHFNFLIPDKNGPLLIRQHASALISTLYAAHFNTAYEHFYPILITCQTKWLELCRNDGIQELSQSVLISACIRTSNHLLMNQNKIKDNSTLLNVWSTSVPTMILKKLIIELNQSSILLSTNSDRSIIHKPLRNMGSIVFADEQSGPSLILARNNSVILLNSYLELFLIYPGGSPEVRPKLLEFHENLLDYLKQISTTQLNDNIGRNWFTRFELKFLTNILLLIVKHDLPISRILLLQTAFQVLTCLSKEFSIEALNILENVIFKSRSYDQNLSEQTDGFMEECKTYYYRAYGITSRTPQMWLEDINWREKFLPKNWPFLPLFGLYKKIQNPNEYQHLAQEIGEEEIITICNTYSMLLEINGIDLLSPIEKYVYLMFSFFGIENKFLEPRVRNLLTIRRTALSQQFRGITLNFDSKIIDNTIPFENIYILFLEQFQGTSYGDPTFSSLLMVPLAQKYDNKWRKIVWSEHIAALRFINCSVPDLLTSFDDFCYPEETDVSLLKCYKYALQSNLLREKSIPYEIAKFHVNHFMSTRTSTDKTK